MPTLVYTTPYATPVGPRHVQLYHHSTKNQVKKKKTKRSSLCDLIKFSFIFSHFFFFVSCVHCKQLMYYIA